MPPLAELQIRAETANLTLPPRPSAEIVPLRSQVPERSSILDWALASAAAAEQRIADLQARLLHLESLSVTDELTGALNRRGLLGDLSRALANAKRGGPAGVLAMIDLDGFKGVNDTLGHNAGDEVLRQVTSLMMRKVRGTDTVAQLGGDEFALILPATTLSAARRKASCLVKAICGLRLPTTGTSTAIGASCGLAPFDGSETAEQLLERADMAMYADKRSRRALRESA